MTPRFEHGCESCTLIGRLGEFDIYTCPQHGHPTIVARYGNDGPEYLSGPFLLLPSLGIRVLFDVEDDAA